VRPLLAIAKTEFLQLRRDPFAFVILLAVPLVVVTFTVPTFRVVLRYQGEARATGAEQAVPGMAVMFGLVVVGTSGYVFFREHGWNTWIRLRLAVPRTASIVGGKILAPLTIVFVQQAALLAFGCLFLGLDARSAAIAFLIVTPPFAAMVVSLGLLVMASFRTLQQMQAVQGLMTIVFSGLGGALTPTEVLPGWAQALSPWTPGHSAVEGYRALLLHDQIGFAARHAAILCVFAVAFFLAAARRFRVDATKDL
jgi:ABC-2 type transport system permease protein